MVSQMAAHWLNDKKFVGLNLAGSDETINLSITRIDGYVASDSSSINLFHPKATAMVKMVSGQKELVLVQVLW